MNDTAAKPESLQMVGLHKRYWMGHEEIHVLRGAELCVTPGEWVCVVGASGSGKSTLLHLLGGLDTPDQGSVIFRGQNLFELPGPQRDHFRSRHVGFVFQFYHLLPELSVLENTIIAAMVGRSIAGWVAEKRAVKQRALKLLEDLGLADRLKHRPNQLSGGERQRVAIARALINGPAVLLADEPTGNLDRKTGGQILEVLGKLHAAGQTIVMVTHDQEVAKRADRSLTLEGGKLRA
jgi:lipoprotein-releasing system ATP-binding protein